MAQGPFPGELTTGISPDQARADYLARRIEEIRRALEPLSAEEDLDPSVRRALALLDRLPPQD